MPKYIGAVPAYGRDYTSKAAVMSDWDAGKDFIMSDIGRGGRYINKSDAKRESPLTVTVRYGKLRKSMNIEVTP